MQDLFSIEKVVKTEQLLGILARNGSFMEKSQDILMIVTEALEEITSFGLFYPALAFFRRNFDGIRGQPSFDQVIITVPVPLKRWL